MTGDRALVISLHDVSPHTWPACREILSQLEALGAPPVSLLAIPDHHRKGHFLADDGFRSWLREQSARGHEAVIHGYYHQRARSEGESWRTRMTTRVYTADEGEFYDISEQEADALLRKARAEFEQLELNPRGFIAPAWLLSLPAEAALKSAGIEYTTRLQDVQDLQTGTRHASQSLVWSVRAAWRRQVSLLWNAFLFSRLTANPLLRISIHPVDLHHPAIWRQICRFIRAAQQQDRQALTYADWVFAQRDSAVVAP
jgi:predicted deacetylase